MIEDIFKSAVTHHNKKNLSILQNYAALLSQIKEYKKAGDTFKKCLEIKPKDSLLLYNYGKFFHEQKIYDKAIRFYQESFKINSKNDMSQYNIGNIYLDIGNIYLLLIFCK